MNQKALLSVQYDAWIAVVLVIALSGCSGWPISPAAQTRSATATYTSQNLNTSYSGALSALDQLMLGTLRLEETPQAVTLDQAKALLPLWQALPGSVLKAEAERRAVLAQIEATMTPEQLQAITAMQLTQESMVAWQQSQGRPPGMPGEASVPGGGGGFGNMSDEQRAALRATMQAGGGFPPGGGGGFGNMSDEQRAALRATRQAGGGGGTGGGTGSRTSGSSGGGTARSAGTAGNSARQPSFLMNALIRLLTDRAGQGARPSTSPRPLPAQPATPTPVVRPVTPTQATQPATPTPAD